MASANAGAHLDVTLRWSGTQASGEGGDAVGNGAGDAVGNAVGNGAGDGGTAPDSR
jgi:hypothetical protein